MPKLKKTLPVHPIPTGYDFTKDIPLSRTRAIREKCLEYCGGAPGEVRNCAISDCTLWPWRSGRVSARKRAQKTPVSFASGAQRPVTPSATSSVQKPREKRIEVSHQ